ncbi:MAG: hypothetical protein AB1665_01715 [Candidatus Thermoplasmatota archaeon]
MIPEKLKNAMEVIGLALLCMPVLGYLYFAAFLPNVVWPVPQAPPVLLIMGTGALLGLLAGLAMDGIESVVYASVLTGIFSILFATILLLSPLWSPAIADIVPEELVATGLRMSLPGMLVSIGAFFVAGVIGQAVRESICREEGDAPPEP